MNSQRNRLMVRHELNQRSIPQVATNHEVGLQDDALMIERGEPACVAIVGVHSRLHANDHLALGAHEMPFVARHPIAEGNDPVRRKLGRVDRRPMLA